MDTPLLQYEAAMRNAGEFLRRRDLSSYEEAPLYFAWERLYASRNKSLGVDLIHETTAERQDREQARLPPRMGLPPQRSRSAWTTIDGELRKSMHESQFLRPSEVMTPAEVEAIARKYRRKAAKHRASRASAYIGAAIGEKNDSESEDESKNFHQQNSSHNQRATQLDAFEISGDLPSQLGHKVEKRSSADSFDSSATNTRGVSINDDNSVKVVPLNGLLDATTQNRASKTKFEKLDVQAQPDIGVHFEQTQGSTAMDTSIQKTVKSELNAKNVGVSSDQHIMLTKLFHTLNGTEQSEVRSGERVDAGSTNGIDTTQHGNVSSHSNTEASLPDMIPSVQTNMTTIIEDEESDGVVSYSEATRYLVEQSTRTQHNGKDSNRRPFRQKTGSHDSEEWDRAIANEFQANIDSNRGSTGNGVLGRQSQSTNRFYQDTSTHSALQACNDTEYQETSAPAPIIQAKVITGKSKHDNATEEDEDASCEDEQVVLSEASDLSRRQSVHVSKSLIYQSRSNRAKYSSKSGGANTVHKSRRESNAEENGSSLDLQSSQKDQSEDERDNGVLDKEDLDGSSQLHQQNNARQLRSRHSGISSHSNPRSSDIEADGKRIYRDLANGRKNKDWSDDTPQSLDNSRQRSHSMHVSRIQKEENYRRRAEQNSSSSSDSDISEEERPLRVKFSSKGDIVWPPGMKNSKKKLHIPRYGVVPVGLEGIKTEKEWRDYWLWLHWYSSWQVWYLENDKKTTKKSNRTRHSKSHTAK